MLLDVWLRFLFDGLALFLLPQQITEAVLGVEGCPHDVFQTRYKDIRLIVSSDNGVKKIILMILLYASNLSAILFKNAKPFICHPLFKN